MHNIDRIMNEEMNQEYGFLNEGEMNPEYEFANEGEYEWEWEGEGEYSHEVMNEELEYELAAELLAINNEQELEQFLGKLVSRAAKGISSFAKSNVGRTLIGGLKSVAKKALPFAARAVGTAFGGPIGGMIGGKLGTLASNLFEIQMEGMSNEDREFEVARRVVRLTTAAGQRAAAGARNSRGVAPSVIARNALKQAAAQHAPGLLTPAGGGGAVTQPSGGAASGTWVRRGGQIIVNL